MKKVVRLSESHLNRIVKKILNEEYIGKKDKKRAEDRLHDLIFKYIEETYPINDIHYTEGYDDDGNPDDSSYVFYFGDWNEGDETIFRWYGENYWEGDDTEILRHRIGQSPILHFEDSRDVERLHSLFGDRWKPVFKEWFEYYFDLNVKTIK